MALETALTHTPLLNHPDVRLIASGKVREIYELKNDPRHLLFVATDRVSAFDVVLATAIPSKGTILTLLSQFWFEFFKHELPDVPTHFVAIGLPQILKARLPQADVNLLDHRTMVVKRLDVLPLESICRGYISGSAWSSYRDTNTVNGIPLPAGLQESAQLPNVLWTPSTKASSPSEHDENISAEKAAEIVGNQIAKQVETLSRRIYATAANFARQKGIIIADTKFEFGLDQSVSPPAVVLCDEVLTPDSSRFWNAGMYSPGRSQPSLDKQPLRDWLASSGFKGKADVELPIDIAEQVERRYKDAYKTLAGKDFPVD